MKVILLKDVEKLGREGEIKEVAEGYARNFLLPQNFAKPATDQAIQEVELKKEKKTKSDQLELAEAQKIAEQLDGRELFIKVKEKEGKLFGSVNEKTIAKNFADEGLKVEPKNVILAEPNALLPHPPHTSIHVPICTAAWPSRAEGQLAPVEVAVHVFVEGL